MKPHSLRHTFAAMLIVFGYDIMVVKELVGHADIRTSMIYAKPDMDILKGAVKMIEDGDDLVTRQADGEENR